MPSEPHREWLAPRSPLEVCLLPPVFLNYCLNDSGEYDVWVGFPRNSAS